MVIAVCKPLEFAFFPPKVLRYNTDMRIKPILFFGVVALIAGYLVYKQADPNEIKVGKLAPDVTVKDQSGNQMKLSDLRGNLVFLNVWATDCAPCVQEMPDMEVMNRAFRDRKFKMVTVSIDTDWKPVTEFFAKYRLTMPVYLDPGRSVYNAFHLTGTPETFLIDRNGIILRHTIGADRWASDSVLAGLDKLIKQQEMPQVASD
jgi:cytochrome c biogenesis protein CcmG/thiol:disulfide interchange protein DsbE